MIVSFFSTAWAFLMAHPAMDVYVLAGLMTLVYVWLGQSSNARVHAFFQLLKSMGFDAQGAASALVSMATGKPLPSMPQTVQAAMTAAPALGPVAAEVAKDTAALDAQLKQASK